MLLFIVFRLHLLHISAGTLVKSGVMKTKKTS